MLINLYAKFQAYKTNIDGATAIEYGLIAGGISLAIVAGVFAFGDSLDALFTNLGTAMTTAGAKVTTDSGGIK